MNRVKNLLSKKFGRLKVISITDERQRKGIVWKCLCKCGNEILVSSRHLQDGGTKSCGCWNTERTRKMGKKSRVHGHSWKNGKQLKSPEYYSWATMKQRCLNKNAPNYDYYGGRGIRICEEWMAFPNFLNDMGKRTKGKSLDRIDPDGNYEPENCRWSNPDVQVKNRRMYIE